MCVCVREKNIIFQSVQQSIKGPFIKYVSTYLGSQMARWHSGCPFGLNPVPPRPGYTVSSGL